MATFQSGMASWTALVVPSAEDLGPFEALCTPPLTIPYTNLCSPHQLTDDIPGDFRGPQGESTSRPYLAPTLSAVLEAGEEMQKRTTAWHGRPRTMSETSRTMTNFAPADVQGSTVVWLGAALAAALLL